MNRHALTATTNEPPDPTANPTTNPRTGSARRRRRALAAPFVVTLALGAAACSSSDGISNPAAPDTDAPQPTQPEPATEVTAVIANPASPDS